MCKVKSLSTYMKVRELIRRLYEAILKGKQRAEPRIYEKITRKSLKHKRTQAVR